MQAENEHGSKGEVRPPANKDVGPEDKIEDEKDESFAAETQEPSAKS
jgi:hypothetical protein